MAFTTTLPLFNTEYHGTSSRTAGIITACYSLFSSLVRTFTGSVSDKFGGGKCVKVGLYFIILGSIILALSPPGNAFTFYSFTGIPLLAIGSGFANSATYK
jgi:NNP family nitrate/nitrite transporter-like MFS transporter